MKNYFVSFAVPTIMLFLASSVFAAGTYSGGDGLSSATAFQIADATDMQEIGVNSDDWDKYFILTENIDLSVYTGASFNIIGNYTIPFIGTFDGDGYTIDNFNYTSTETDCIGLFGQVGFGGAIKNLGMTNVNVDAGTGIFAACLVGFNAGSITNCYSAGSVNGQWYVGGLVGSNQGSVTNSYSSGYAKGDWYVGGLAGENFEFGSVTNSYSSVSVDGIYSLGGLVGINDGYAWITNSYSTGSVNGAYSVGGLVGSNGEDAWITNSYSAGGVSGDLYVGGMVGFNSGYVTNSYFLDHAGPDNSCGKPLSDAAMKQRSSFAGFDFGSDDGDPEDYRINEGRDYPRLYWQLSGDLDNDGYVNLSDFAIISAAWGTSVGDANYNSVCELSGDPTIDMDDLTVLINNWLESK